MDISSHNLKNEATTASDGHGEVAYRLSSPPAKSNNAPTMPKLAPKPSYESASTAPFTAPNIRRRKKIKRHHCGACDKCFSGPSKLSDHQFSHTGELPYSCQLCDKKFNSKSKLGRHGLTHRAARAFACLKCDKSFHRKDHLTNHIRVHDPVRRLLVCEHAGCGKHYSSILSFRNHSAIHAAEGGRLDCTICGAAFNNSAELLQHIKMHTGSRNVKNDNEKKFPCDQCNRRFNTAKDVRRHQVVHTGRRDFACLYCPQKFGRKDHVYRHVKNSHVDIPLKHLETAQGVVVEAEEKPKHDTLNHLGSECSPNASKTCVNPSGTTSTPPLGELSTKSYQSSTANVIFIEVPIEIDTVIKQEPLSDVEETDTSNLDNLNIKTEIS